MTTNQQFDNALYSIGGYILILLRDGSLDRESLHASFRRRFGEVKYTHLLWVIEILKMRGAIKEVNYDLKLNLY